MTRSHSTSTTHIRTLRPPIRSIISLSLIVLLSLSASLFAQTPAAYNNLGPSSSSIINDVKYFGSSFPVHETTTAFDTVAGYGHTLGYSVTNKGQQSIVQTDALGGYAYGSTSFQSSSQFKCEVLQLPQCIANDMYCNWVKDKGCLTKHAVSGVSLKPLLPASPYFFSKLNLHAKGTVRTVFVDFDTRTRLGEVDAFRARAVAFFKEVYGLNFEYFNTYEGAQMIPFKWTDEMYLQIQDAFLPPFSETIPERNRVLVDGFMVKPLAGESVVLGGLYANNKKAKTVFLEAHEVLIFLEYRVVDEYYRLYHTFEFYLKYPLSTNRVGIAGWTATVVRRDPLTGLIDENWGVGVDQGILEIVTFDDLQDFAFTSVITFDGMNKNVTKHALYGYEPEFE